MIKVLKYPKLQTIAFSNRLLSLCQSARESNVDHELVFNLEKTEFLTPFGIVLLAGTIEECLANGFRVKYIIPKKVKTANFLSGIGFNRFFSIPDANHRIQSANIQLRRLTELDILFSDQIIDVFGANFSMTDGVKGSLKMSLNELMTNAFDHSKSRKGCYVCVQTYNRSGIIRLCIADFGIGILSALRKNPEYAKLKKDQEAIRLSVQEGVTSRVQRVAGLGLFHIQRFIKANEGKLFIMSGKGKLLWHYDPKKILRGKEQTMHTPFQGTIINLLINADRESLYFLRDDLGVIF